ncbi:hypothetical protein E4U42_003110 [Claviceps africana]|uniref:Ribokinase n=1 Tax=Claviceps africana TaxID=83212 RepID=A0A8K0J746_9HYPO|nr:hypothetical protein E4U42_003110 [Claviceps africana]
MAHPSPLITILGSLNMDLVSYVPHHPLPGETLTSTSFRSSPGGKGANQAVACAKLSRRRSSSSAAAQVSMLGAVGNDAHGQTLLAGLAAHGIDTRGIRTHPILPTGIALIIVDQPTGQNRIILSPEANHGLPPDDFAGAFYEPRRPDLLVMQLEIPLPTVLRALATARRDGVPVLLNPAPAQVLPADAYDGLAHLVVNETEAGILSGGGQDGEPEPDLDSPQGLASVADAFLARGVQNVVITLGERGVYYASALGPRALVEAVETDVVDTTAAGDTFVGSYALAFVRARHEAKAFDIDAAVRAANKASSITVSRKGAQISIPWMDELQ